MKKIGLLGGAFDPPTIGHSTTAQQVLANAPDISEVWLMPCNSHNFGKDMTNPEHRLRMCEIASEEIPGLSAWDYEIAQKRDGCTFNTVTALLADSSLKYEFAWIIGGDNALVFEQWHRHQELRDLIEFVVVPRPGYQLDTLPSVMSSTVQHHRLVGEDPNLISSTKVRDWLRKGEYNQAAEWVHPTVLEYILEHSLYQKGN